jgi:DNA polymerase-3 subunit delta'
MPWSFADLLGQEETLRRLNREFASGRMAHAYMLEGREGTGKLTLARGMAGRLFCLAPGQAGEACGACRPCRLLARDNHPDFLELPRKSADLRLGRFLERTGGPERIEHQPLLPFLRMKPVESAWRAAIIPVAERMRAEAANAFLKTLEEPPGPALLILTVNSRDRLPATIASRCRRLGLRPLLVAAISSELVRRGAVPAEDADGLAEAAEGSLGRALELAETGVAPLWRWLDGQAFLNPGMIPARELAAAWTEYLGKRSDAGEKRRDALFVLGLGALAVRRLLRRGLAPRQAARALEAFWLAGEQVAQNVGVENVLVSTAFEVMSILRR